MRDSNLLGTADAAVAAEAFATSALGVNKTPSRGVWVQFVITRNDNDSDETLDITIYGKAANSAWATSDDPVAILDQVADGDVADGATIVKYVLVQTKHAYIKPYYNVAGTTPSFDVTYGIVPATARDAVA